MSKKMFSMHLDVDAFLPASAEEKEYMVQMRPSSTFSRDGVKRFVKNKVALISLLIVVIITISCIFIPFFFPYSYDQMLGVKLGRPVDASYNAINKLINPPVHTLEKYSINAVSEGKDTLGEAMVKLKVEGEDDLVSGRGLSTDIVEASILAYLNALEKII